MIRKLAITFAITIIVLILIVSCAPPRLTPTTTPAPTPELQIPPHFTTYTSEGLFSISYPPDWAPATAMMEDVWEEVKEWIKSVDPEVSVEEQQVLFLGGIPIEEGYYPNVNIMVTPRAIGYWTLNEIVEADDVWCREHLQKYREYSQINTNIGEREAVISDWEAYDPDLVTWRYLTAYIVKDKFLWTITCSAESGEFKDFEDDFYAIIRSLRILN